GTIRFLASALRSEAMSSWSPRTAASMSVVIRRTPRAMTAIPPITIHGTAVAFSAAARSASAASSLGSPLLPGFRTLLDPRPPAAHLENSRFADQIPRPRPDPHRFERGDRGERLGDGLRGAGTLAGGQFAASLTGEHLPASPASNGGGLVASHG